MTHVLTDLVFYYACPHISFSLRLENYNQHQDMSAQEDFMLLCHGGRYCFSEKGFNSHFIETDRAIHHSQAHVEALFKQCQWHHCSTKRMSTAQQPKLPIHFISSFFLFLFFEQNEAVWLVFLSAQAPALHKDMDQSE